MSEEQADQVEEELKDLAALPRGSIQSVEPTQEDIEKEHRIAALAQTLKLRGWVALFVGLMLGAELVALFLIVVWQGRGHFDLNEWAFTAIVNGVLLQTFYSFRTIVTHLFPDGAKEFTK